MGLLEIDKQDNGTRFYLKIDNKPTWNKGPIFCKPDNKFLNNKNILKNDF